MQLLISTAYLPPIAYMLLLKHFGTATIEIHETYPKQTWRNRCRIITANGLLDLSIPVSKPFGRHTQTGEMLISDHAPWQRHHWRSLVSAYQKSPYFIHYAPVFETFYAEPFTASLTEWNALFLHTLLKEIGLDVDLSTTTSYQKQDSDSLDIRDALSPKRSWPDDISGLKWPPYMQVFDDKHGFVANLSAIDLLFNLGPESVIYIDKCLSALPAQLKVG